MGNFNQKNKFGGGGRRGGGNFRGRDSGHREMHQAVCDNCGQNCEVPFKPSGDKPIYCRNCFEKKNGGSSNKPGERRSGGSGFGSRDGSSKQVLEQLKSLNAKLDRVLKAIESGDKTKPVSKTPKTETKERNTASKSEKPKIKKKSKKEVKDSTPKVI